MNLTEVSIRRPVLAWMIMIAAVVFGLVAGDRLGISQFPDVDFPTLNISLRWEGASPEVMESDIVEAVEEAMVQVEGVRSITSVSKQGEANVTLDLEMGRDVDLALQDVQTRISQAGRSLPPDMDPPVVQKTNPEDQPILWLAVGGPFSRQYLSDFARYRVKERLQTIAGVGEIFLGGYLARNVRIWVDASKMDARGLTVGDIIQALHRQHVELPAGFIQTEGREVSVRVMGEALDLTELRRLVVREINNAPVLLEDVALVEDGFEDARRLGRANGEPAQGLGIKKQRGANAVAVAQSVKAALEEIRRGAPEGLNVFVNFDSTQFIEESVHEIELELVLAVLLTAFVCWLFLGSLSSTLNVVLAIPMSLLGTVAAIYFLGFTLNTFTLLALGLAVGIVVDDAIMVMENVYRHGEMGKDRKRAAAEGTKEITFAALTATVAVVAIFLPVIFMEGIVGRFFLQFGVTLSIAVLISYLEAITLAPARLSQMMSTQRERTGRLGHAADHAFAKLAEVYAWVLTRALAHPVKVLVAAAGIFVASVFGMTTLPKEFVPSQDQSRLMIRGQTAVGSTLEETDRVFRRAEATLLARPEVARAFGVIGGFGGAGVNTAVMFVTLVPPGDRALSQADFAMAMRKELNGIPGLRAVVQDLSQQGFTARRGFPVEFSVRGNDWGELVAATDRIKAELQESNLVVDLDTDYLLGQPELRILPDRARAADLGVPIEDVASTINALVGGVRVGKFNASGRRIDVRLRLLAEQRSRPEDIARLKVRTAKGTLVPLSALVTSTEQPALQAITRVDRERAITVFANPAPGASQEQALAKVEALAKKATGGVRVVLGGQSQAFKQSMSSLLFALFLGIAVAYMVLGAQFNSFLHPVTVLTILPLSIAGAVAALFLSGKSLNIFSMIGLLLLMGIVKKNSIILVDYATQLRMNDGAGAREAMQRAGPLRLRPILMTSVATLMAAVPTALELGPGSEIRAPMALAVIGGLVVSTPLSLLVVPSFYVVADRLVEWMKRLRGGKAAQPITPEAGSSTR